MYFNWLLNKKAIKQIVTKRSGKWKWLNDNIITHFHIFQFDCTLFVNNLSHSKRSKCRRKCGTNYGWLVVCYINPQLYAKFSSRSGSSTTHQLTTSKCHTNHVSGRFSTVPEEFFFFWYIYFWWRNKKFYHPWNISISQKKSHSHIMTTQIHIEWRWLLLYYSL